VIAASKRPAKASTSRFIVTNLAGLANRSTRKSTARAASGEPDPRPQAAPRLGPNLLHQGDANQFRLLIHTAAYC